MTLAKFVILNARKNPNKQTKPPNGWFYFYNSIGIIPTKSPKTNPANRSDG